jgi:ankyrin repeat protein
MSTGRIDVNLANQADDGWTALHYASHESHDHLVEHLLRQFNAEVDIMSSNGRTPLHVACNRLNKKVIERLLLAGANANL